METRRNKTCWQTKNEMEGKFGYISEKKGVLLCWRLREMDYLKTGDSGGKSSGRATDKLFSLPGVWWWWLRIYDQNLYIEMSGT